MMPWQRRDSGGARRQRARRRLRRRAAARDAIACLPIQAAADTARRTPRAALLMPRRLISSIYYRQTRSLLIISHVRSRHLRFSRPPASQHSLQSRAGRRPRFRTFHSQPRPAGRAICRPVIAPYAAPVRLKPALYWQPERQPGDAKMRRSRRASRQEIERTAPRHDRPRRASRI